MDDSDIVGLRLAQCCKRSGLRICRKGALVRRQLNQYLDEPMSDDEWNHYGQVASFLAFVELGGTEDGIEHFNWSSPEFLRRALSLLQQYTLGSQSELYDNVMRSRKRLSPVHIDELSWDAWHEASPTDLDGHRNVSERAKQEHALRVRSLGRKHYEVDPTSETHGFEEQLVDSLRTTLKPHEAEWLVRRYRDGVPTAVLASELVDENEKYQTGNGFTRAVRCIDVAVHRAKAKARKLLSPTWQQLAKEVA